LDGFHAVRHRSKEVVEAAVALLGLAEVGLDPDHDALPAFNLSVE
jgi:hypothetical protein